MYKMTSSAIATALLLGASSLAMAQSTTTSPSATPAPGSAPSMNSSSGLSGSSSAPMNEAQVKQRLEADGYSNVSDVHKDKDGWAAKAMHNGKSVTVGLDSAGKIETK